MTKTIILVPLKSTCCSFEKKNSLLITIYFHTLSLNFQIFSRCSLFQEFKTLYQPWFLKHILPEILNEQPWLIIMYLKHERESFLFFSKCKLTDDYIAMILLSPFTPRSSFREMIWHSNLNLSKILWCIHSNFFGRTFAKHCLVTFLGLFTRRKLGIFVNFYFSHY